MSLFCVYISFNKFEMICLSKTYLNSSISSIDSNLEVPGFTLVGANNKNNSKGSGVFIYCINLLPLKVLDIQFLHECLNFKINISGKVCSLL